MVKIHTRMGCVTFGLIHSAIVNSVLQLECTSSAWSSYILQNIDCFENVQPYFMPCISVITSLTYHEHVD